MTATLSESQARLPKLVEIASKGEDVVITIEGKPTAKLTRIEPEAPVAAFDGAAWLMELEELNRRHNPDPASFTSAKILAETREDRF